jgi:CRISPR-associated endonuclease Csn1
LSGRTGNQLILRNGVSLKLNDSEIETLKLIEKEAESNISTPLVNEKDCILLFETLLEKYNMGILKMRPNNVAGKIEEKRQEFMQLDAHAMCVVLLQIVQLMKIGVAYGDLSLIKMAPKSGVMLTSKKISKALECILVNQSVTGLFENTIDLLTV